MHRAILASGLVCALAAAGMAVGYNDAADGNWSNVATWGGGGPPGAGDTAVIDSNTVTADVAINPGIVSVDIRPNGTLYINNNLQVAPAATLTLNGGILRMEQPGISTYTPIVVSAASSIVSANPEWWDPNRLFGSITDGGTTGLLSLSGRLTLGGTATGFTGGMDMLAGSAIGTAANDCLGSGPLTIRGFFENGGTQSATPSSINVYGTFRESQNADLAWALTMQPGSALELNTFNGITGTMSVNGGTTYIRDVRNGTPFNYNGVISGTGKIILQNTSDGGCTIGLGADNSGFTGDWDLSKNPNYPTQSVANINNVKALGDNTGGTVTVKPNAIMNLNGIGSATFARNFTMEDASTVNYNVSGGVATMTGAITLQSGVETFNVRGTMNLDGAISGAGKAYLYPASNSQSGTINLDVANSHGGGTQVDSSLTVRTGGAFLVNVKVANALGTGVTTVTGGELQSNPANTANAVLASPSRIDVVGGALLINSTETRSVNILESGALWITGGGTAMTYGVGTGVFQVYNNAILDKTSIIDAALALPAAGDIQGTATQNQVLQGYRANYAAESWLGPGAGGNGGGAGAIIWGGIGNVQTNISMTAALHEYTAGGGFTLASQKNRRLTADSAGGANLDATGPINLVGNGDFLITNTPFNNVAGNINKSGLGQIQIQNIGGLPGNKTLNVNAGYLSVSVPGALAGTVNVNSGGLFLIGQDITTGIVNVNAGGFVCIGADTRLGGGATFNWANGAKLVLAGNNLTNAVTALAGKADFILTHKDNSTYSNFVLNDNARITLASDFTLNTSGTINAGEVQASANQARLAAQSGHNLNVNSKVNLPGQKLIIGDLNPYKTSNSGGTLSSDINQTGQVSLNLNTNTIGSIDVQAGTLMIGETQGGYNDEGRLGGATTINVAGGGVLYMNSTWASTWTPYAVITGNGTVTTRYYTGSGGPSTLNIQPKWDGAALTAAALSPGASAGTLTVNGHLAFGKVDVVVDVPDVTQEWRYGQFRCQVTGSAGVPGSSFDKVIVTNTGAGGLANANLANGELVIDLPIPSGALNPTALKTQNMTILTAGTLSNTFASVVKSGAASSWWTIDSGAVSYTATDVVLGGSAIHWTALEGDADLDRNVDFTDYQILEANFGSTTGNDWMAGDFDSNGVVNFTDYQKLEANFGSSVPEPATAGLLLAGLAGLLRRRD